MRFDVRQADHRRRRDHPSRRGEADPHALLVAVAHLTGNPAILRDHLRPDQQQLIVPGAGLDDDRIAEARDLAATALIEHRDQGGVPTSCATTRS